MPDNHSLHTFGHGGLPRIVFPHALISASLVQRDAIAMLPPYRLPTKRAQGLTDGYRIFCALQNLRIRDRRHPKIGTGIPRKPSVGWTAPVGGYLVE